MILNQFFLSSKTLNQKSFKIIFTFFIVLLLSFSGNYLKAGKPAKIIKTMCGIPSNLNRNNLSLDETNKVPELILELFKSAGMPTKVFFDGDSIERDYFFQHYTETKDLIIFNVVSIDVDQNYFVISFNKNNNKIIYSESIAYNSNYERSYDYFYSDPISNESFNVYQISTTRKSNSELLTDSTILNVRITESGEISSSKEQSYKHLGSKKGILIEMDWNNYIFIPNMFANESDLSIQNPMYCSPSKFRNYDIISFELSDLYGISGSIEGNKIIVFAEDINIESIKYRLRDGIFYNEEGSGGVWGGAGGKFTEPVFLKRLNNTFTIPKSNSQKSKPIIDKDALKEAKEKTDADHNLSFMILRKTYNLTIIYSDHTGKKQKEIQFVVGHGD